MNEKRVPIFDLSANVWVVPAMGSTGALSPFNTDSWGLASLVEMIEANKTTRLNPIIGANESKNSAKTDGVK